MATQNFVTNKKIAKQFFEYFQSGERNKIESELFDKTYKLHFPGYEYPLNIKESLDLMNLYKNAFPDIKFKIDCQVAEGDFVVTRLQAHGTHKGEFQGIAPTNKEVNVSSISIHRIKDGKITDEWVELDSMRLMRQIGIVPEMASSNH